MNLIIIAIYEVRRMLRIRSVMLILIGLPLLLIFILGSALSSAFTVKDMEIEQLSIAVFAEDQGELINGLQAYLDSAQVSKYIVDIPTTSREAVIDLIKAREVDMGLIIPAGFSAAVFQGKSAEWEVIVGGNRTKNMTGNMLLQAFLDQTNRIQTEMIVLGPPSAGALGGSADQVGASVKVGQSTQAAAPDNGSRVEIGKLSRSGLDYTATQYYAAAMLVMFLLYSGMSAAISLVNEKENHTLTRLMSLPLKPMQVFYGKLLGQTFISIGQASIIILATIFFYNVHWGNSVFYLLLLCLSTIFISMCLAIIVTMLVQSTKAVMSIFQALIILMSFVSGGYNPDVGPFLQSIAQFTISHWASRGLLRLMLEDKAEVILHHITILGSIGIGLFLISLTIYRKVGYHE